MMLESLINRCMTNWANDDMACMTWHGMTQPQLRNAGDQNNGAGKLVGMMAESWDREDRWDGRELREIDASQRDPRSH